MNRRSLIATMCFFTAACGSRGAEPPAPNQPTPYNVILVTLDGVRWQELIDGSDPLLTKTPEPVFPHFWSTIEPRGRLYGNRHHGSSMRVTTVANASLPGYTSLYAERDQGCLTNACARITVPTFVDRLHDELEIPQSKLLVFASWRQMRLAVTGRDDVAMVYAGLGELDEDHLKSDRSFESEESFEFDRHAAEDAFAALEKGQPRFLHLALLDSDRYGHQGRYQKYVEVLKASDRLLADLVEHLERSGEYGRNTAIVVTTDHGRGLWDQWGTHGPHVPASAHVFAFVMLPPAATEFTLVSELERQFSHHDVRYTIDTLFGLSTPKQQTGFITRSGPGQ